MTLWKRQNRSGDLLGPNCLRGPLFSFAVKQLYTDTHCVTALQSYTAIQRYTLYSYTSLYSIQPLQHPSGDSKPKRQKVEASQEAGAL